MRLVVVAPHPDDEILSTGALLLRAREEGVASYILWLTEGKGSSSSNASQRWAEANRVAVAVNAEVLSLGLNERDITDAKLTPEIEKHLKALRPQIVAWPFGEAKTQHQNHVELHNAMRNILTRWPYHETCWLAGRPPVYSDPGFIPNLYLSYDRWMLGEQKQLMAFYDSESKKLFAHQTFIETKARGAAFDGHAFTASTPFAEPYMLFKGTPPADLLTTCAIDFYQSKSGKVPAQDFLDSLSKEDSVAVNLAILQTRLPAYRKSTGVADLVVPLSKGQVHIFYGKDATDTIVILHITSNSNFIQDRDMAAKRLEERQTK